MILSWIDVYVGRMRALIAGKDGKRIRLICARCGKLWRGGHLCG